MPSLVCSAQSCGYNEAMYCCKGDILVGGEEAESSGDTCCTSFRENTGTSARNSMGGSPSQTIYVDCDACNCVYNEEHKCHAEKIDIMGASASRSEQTACATFREE